MFISFVVLPLLVLYLIASVIDAAVKYLVHDRIEWRIFTIEKFGYMAMLVLLLCFAIFVYSDFKQDAEHREYGIKVGKVFDIQYISGGVDTTTEKNDNAYYKVFIANEFGDREEVWGAGSKDAKALYIGKEVKLDTTTMHYISTLKKPVYVQNAHRQ